MAQTKITPNVMAPGAAQQNAEESLTTLSTDSPSPAVDAVMVRQSGGSKWWSWSNFVNFLKTLFPAKDAAGNSMVGDFEVLGSLTKSNQPTVTTPTDSEVVTLRALKSLNGIPAKSLNSPLLDKMGGTWTNPGMTSNSLHFHGRMIGGFFVISDGLAFSKAVTISPTSTGPRGRVGNVKASGFSSADFTSRFYFRFNLNYTAGRFSFANDSVGFVFGSQIPYNVLTAGLTPLFYGAAGNQAAFLATDLYVGFTLETNGTSLDVYILTKLPGAAPVKSAVLGTIANTNNGDLGDFLLVSHAGTVSLYRNEILIGSVTGGPNTTSGAGAWPAFCYSTSYPANSNATYYRELMIQGLNISWE